MQVEHNGKKNKFFIAIVEPQARINPMFKSWLVPQFLGGLLQVLGQGLVIPGVDDA